MSYGWNESAAAWVRDQGEAGDYSREFVLDPKIIGLIEGRGFANALDVGCGEGRFCRIMQRMGIATVGVDIAPELIRIARERDPQGDYRLGDATALALPDNAFDLVLSYVTLIDFPDIAAAIAEMARVLRPGGSLLLANLSSFASAGAWHKEDDAYLHYAIDNYSEERGEWQEWRDIRVFNWHRPLRMYMQNFLKQGLILRHFDEPLIDAGAPGSDPERNARHRRIPWFVVMEWAKPAS